MGKHLINTYMRFNINEYLSFEGEKAKDKLPACSVFKESVSGFLDVTWNILEGAIKHF